MNSLHRRLWVGLTLALLLVLALLYQGLQQILATLYQQQLLTRLQHDAELILQAFDPVGWQLAERGVMPIYQRPLSGHYFQIHRSNPETLLRSRSLWDEELPRHPLATGQEQQWEWPLGSQRLLLWQKGYQKRGIPFTLTLAEDLNLAVPLQQRLRHWFAGAAVLALLLLTLAHYGVVRYGLASVEALRQQLLRLRRGEQQQLALTDTPTELQPLVAELNQLLRQLEERLQRSRHAAGNLAHALKGSVGHLLQLAESREGDPPIALQPAIHQEVMALQQQLERELKRARLAGTALPGRFFQPQQELPLMQQLLERIYLQKPLQFEFSYPEQRELPFDRDDMLELIGNLLDNGCKWARSRVRGRLSFAAEQFELQITDDGVGCAPEQLALLTQRGVRIDESRSGSGLGLAIVADIVTLYGGTLQLAQSREWGGLEVTVVLPQRGGELKTSPPPSP